MTRQVRTSTGAAYDLGYHVVWCPKYRPVLGGRVKDRLEELICAKADEHDRQIVALEVMPESRPDTSTPTGGGARAEVV
ncbi:IS200/IS605 family transposase [Streptosporangium sp. LJ11]|uniref:IS200/IS605 family transposase n=1 Tax=Streptosporangium sp. LJ11 TaxID=3436927 RepID=UPI003F7AF4B4